MREGSYLLIHWDITLDDTVLRTNELLLGLLAYECIYNTVSYTIFIEFGE
jgi:hypothetical protein